MAKRLVDETDLTEEGYVVGVSPVKISRNNKYFNGKIQTEQKTYNCVCYASEKAVDYQAAERMNSVKLSNIKFTPSIIDKETLDIQITKKRSMQVIKKLNFQKKVETAHDTKPKNENQNFQKKVETAHDTKPKSKVLQLQVKSVMLTPRVHILL